MPMFRSFVPRKIQPWIYLFIAITFQLSGGVYLGALNQMIGGMALMREDILMCMYANLAGMAIYFPLLFRMKFRFTNKTLLTSAALGVLVCNLIAPHITFLPLLWLICFIEGMCKIQGTFECMSNIQLWMTPKRDFTVFFPYIQPKKVPPHLRSRTYFSYVCFILLSLLSYLQGSRWRLRRSAYRRS